LKIKPEEEKVWFFLFPLKMSSTLIWYFTQGLNQAIAQIRCWQIDRQNNRLTGKMTTVTLWRMHTEGSTGANPQCTNSESHNYCIENTCDTYRKWASYTNG